MEMVDRETAREIAKVAAAELAVHVTAEMGEIRGDFRELKACIPGLIAEQIRACQVHQERRRRWSIGSLLTIVGICSSLGIGVAALIGG
jgi:hypothetical protein